ncbi:putative beta-lysine N-acetyltransferase [Metabacillus halosaccharovorans]|uniref:Beta-lysine N-acetyltransferase n=1 Tax=Metabacillus halosaccharovorans TaxID=930124 RepID=A0ABT3DBC8_9BACI|nr:putative beta-lysine N-acetyltransferase [Metabacillus halosaccharovorans]MCV9884161.1 putative beta-lysine N-acetyltransferase [Metabacillus halosaccharovorans]
MAKPYKTVKLSTSDFQLELFLDYFNKRIRIDHYRGNMTRILQEISHISNEDFCEKVLFYSHPEHWRELLSHGYELEGVIPGYFSGTHNYVMTLYTKNERRTSQYWVKENEILQDIKNKGLNMNDKLVPTDYSFRKAEVGDTRQLAELYGKVFQVYPTPMNEQHYVKTMIEGGTYFYLVEYQNEIVSAASADVNSIYHNAELTDCATLKVHRKHGLMKKLLMYLEQDLRKNGVYYTYSLARALSFGMNYAFYQLGYHYHGRLINNCYIFDKLEDMNIWGKDLSS